MSPLIDPLLPVGRDCDCGHPLVWRRGVQVCAVYGSHQPAGPVKLWWDRNAPAAHLVELVMEGDRYGTS